MIATLLGLTALMTTPGAEPPAGALTALRGFVGRGVEARVAWATADLDADGRDELVAFVSGPDVCGSGGCNAYVLTRAGDSWRAVMRSSVTRKPIGLLSERSRGWRDLIVSTGGGGAAGGPVRMRFDGHTYPANPTVQPAAASPSAPDAILIPADAPTVPLP